MKRLFGALGAAYMGRLDEYQKWTHGHAPDLLAALWEASQKKNCKVYFSFFLDGRNPESLGVSEKYFSKDHAYGPYACLEMIYVPKVFQEIRPKFSITCCLRGEVKEIFVCSDRSNGRYASEPMRAFSKIQDEAIAYHRVADKDFVVPYQGWQWWANFFYAEINAENFDSHLRAHRGSWSHVIDAFGEKLVIATRENLDESKKRMKYGGSISIDRGALRWSDKDT